MLIVAGHFVVDPADQAAFVAGRVEAMRATRAEDGCLEYVMAADPVDPSRVVLFERWADQASFDAHMAALAEGASLATGPAPKGVEVKIYDISGERAFG
jgi:quinol monooxygenase YgiN